MKQTIQSIISTGTRSVDSCSAINALSTDVYKRTVLLVKPRKPTIREEIRQPGDGRATGSATVGPTSPGKLHQPFGVRANRGEKINNFESISGRTIELMLRIC